MPGRGLPPPWEFPTGDLTVGQMLDFFGAMPVPLAWHNEFGGPSAYVSIADYDLAETFRDQLKIAWLDTAGAQERRDEDGVRASAR